MISKQSSIGIVLFVAAIILLIVVFTIAFNNKDNYTTEEVPCIDKNGNVFVDEMCERKVMNSTGVWYASPTAYVIFTLLIIIFIFSGIYNLLMGIPD
jgi:Zn-dependent membrane protease YugP